MATGWLSSGFGGSQPDMPVRDTDLPKKSDTCHLPASRTLERSIFESLTEHFL